MKLEVPGDRKDWSPRRPSSRWDWNLRRPFAHWDRWHRVAVVILLVVTTAPYLWARATRPAGTTFGWGLGFLPDTLGNAAFTRQAAEGAVLFGDSFTAEPHPARFFNPLFLLQGWVQRLTGLSPGAVFQLSRVAAALALFAGLIRLIASLFTGNAPRRTAFLLICCSGGLGFLAPWWPAFATAADVNGAEMTTFFSVYQQAHFTVALALITAIAVALPEAVATGAVGATIAAGLAHLFLDAIHPYDAPIPIAAAAVYAVAHRASGRRTALTPLLLFVLFPLPILAWNGWQAAFVPVYRDFAREGLLAPPWPLPAYLLGFGLLLPLAAAGVRDILRTRDPRWLFPLAWLGAVPVLMLTPVPARRKLMEGYHLFLALVAARGVAGLVARRPASRAGLALRRPALGAGLAVLSLSGLYVIGRDLYAVAVSRRPGRPLIGLRDGAIDFPFHGRLDRLFAGTPWMGGIFLRGVDRYDLPDDLLATLRAARTAIPAETVILAAPDTGLFVPMYVARHVVAGHLFGTLRMPEKELAIRAAMDARLSDPARHELVGAVLGAGAILLDDRLAALGGWRPGREPWLTLRSRNGAVGLYAVAPPPTLTPASRSFVRDDIDAGYFKEEGRRLLNEGAAPAAAYPLVQAGRLRPGDPDIAVLLSAARRRRGVPPARPGTRSTE